MNEKANQRGKLLIPHDAGMPLAPNDIVPAIWLFYAASQMLTGSKFVKGAWRHGSLDTIGAEWPADILLRN